MIRILKRTKLSLKDKMQVFSELKVLEIASVLAGPSVGMFFAELGAKVIKIENKLTNGDVTRTWKELNEIDEEISAYYCAVNWNKEVMLLDLTNQKDLNTFDQLLIGSDILIANYKKSTAIKLKMDYDRLSKLNPSLIYANITGFGEEDDRLAYDVVLQAETGFMSLNGPKESGPTKMPVALIDILAAHQLKEGILVAMIEKFRTGKGCYVSVSLKDAAIASLANQATNWLMNGNIPGRLGSLHPNIAPYGEILETKDQKKIVLAIGNDQQFFRFASFLDLDLNEMKQKFCNNSLRIKHRSTLFHLLSDKARNYDAQVLMKYCVHNKIPVGLIKDIKAVFDDRETHRLLLHSIIQNRKSISIKSAVFNLEML